MTPEKTRASYHIFLYSRRGPQVSLVQNTVTATALMKKYGHYILDSIMLKMRSSSMFMEYLDTSQRKTTHKGNHWV